MVSRKSVGCLCSVPASLEQLRDQTARVLMLSDVCKFPSLGGSRRLRSEFWHCKLLTCHSPMALGRFNSIDCAVYWAEIRADALKRGSAFNKHFIFPVCPLWPSKLEKPFGAGWPRSKKRKPSLLLALNSWESGWNMRREDFPVFPTVTFRAVQTLVLNSLEAEASLWPRTASSPPVLLFWMPAQPCRCPLSGPSSRAAAGKRGARALPGGAEEPSGDRRAAAVGSGEAEEGGEAGGPPRMPAAGRAPRPGEAGLGAAVSGRGAEGAAPPRSGARCPPPGLGEQRAAGGAGPRWAAPLPAATCCSAPRRLRSGAGRRRRRPRPGGGTAGAELSGARPCPWCCRRAGGSPAQRGAQPSVDPRPPPDPSRLPPTLRCLLADGRSPRHPVAPGPQPGEEKQRFSERASAQVEICSWRGTMAALPRLVCASSVVLVVWGRCFHSLLSSATFSTKPGACPLQDASLKHRFS